MFRKEEKTGAARTPKSIHTGQVYTISGVKRYETVPDIKGKDFKTEYDIAVFEGDYRLQPQLGYTLPLCKFIVSEGTGFKLDELMDRLDDKISHQKEFKIINLVQALVENGLPHWTAKYDDMFHDFEPLSVTYIWPADSNSGSSA